MKLNTGSLLAMAFLVVGLAAGVGILQLRQLVNTPKASVSSGTVLFNVNNLDVRVILDPQNNPISFAKVELTFDKNTLSVVSFNLNNLLKTPISTPDLTTINSTGVISVTLGLTPADRNNAPATAFDFMTLKFAPKASAGSTSQIVFNATTSQVVDMANQQMSINSTPANIIVSASTSSPTPTPVGINPTPTPTPTVGQPNSCGGTCGSHANCKAGLFCYNGFCRNPQCPSQTDCSCVTYTSNPTPSATPLGARPTPITMNYQPPTLNSPTPTTSVYVEPVSYVQEEENISVWTRLVRFILRLFGIKY